MEIIFENYLAACKNCPRLDRLILQRKFSRGKLDQAFSKILDLLSEILPNILEIIEN